MKSRFIKSFAFIKELLVSFYFYSCQMIFSFPKVDENFENWKLLEEHEG